MADPSTAPPSVVSDTTATASSSSPLSSLLLSFFSLIDTIVAAVPNELLAVLGFGDARRGAISFLLLAAVVTYLLVLAAFRFTRRLSENTADVVLLVGESNSGKTALFFKMQQGEFRATVPSMTHNEAKFIPIGLDFDPKHQPVLSRLRYVDFPGHGSVRYRLASLLPSARAIIFTVNPLASKMDGPEVTLPDSEEKAPTLQSQAEILYSLLTNRDIVRRRVPIMVLLTKADYSSRLSAATVQSELTKIMETMRTMRHTMADLDSSAAKDAIPLTKDGSPFSFSAHSCPIEFGEVSAKNDEMTDVLTFLQQSVVV